MAELAVRIEGLSKRYRIGAAARHPRTLREALAGAAAAPVRNFQRVRALGTFAAADEADVVWALHDVSLDVGHGEVLGIIGRNGAGKSTLLKVLSRITQPTTGLAVIRGRVGSLLEVGTGFHPELSGRDNVYLNGAILGMDRRYIDRRFDEIVEFSGIGRFIDTPVKRYSSGMYLRLAFAVAAHLEPDVLIVDEVLAVGDADFQLRCLGRISDVARDGRTVLFVSHNVGAIQRLCSRTVLLEDGRAVADGPPAEVLRRYLAGGASSAAPERWLDLSSTRRTGSGEATFRRIRYRSSHGVLGGRAYPGGPFDVHLDVVAGAKIHRETIGFLIRDALGAPLTAGSTTAAGKPSVLPQGLSTWRIHIPSLPLRPGVYQLDVWLGGPAAMHDHLQPALQFEVFDQPDCAEGRRVDSRTDGVIHCEYDVVEGYDLGERAEAVRAG